MTAVSNIKNRNFFILPPLFINYVLNRFSTAENLSVSFIFRLPKNKI